MKQKHEHVYYATKSNVVGRLRKPEVARVRIRLVPCGPSRSVCGGFRGSLALALGPRGVLANPLAPWRSPGGALEEPCRPGSTRPPNPDI